MSQTTRCPSCGTKFKVVADQLRISEGWVRCGQCAEVFDATLTLESPVPAAAAVVDPASMEPPAAGYALPAALEDEEEPSVPEAATERADAPRDAEPRVLEASTITPDFRTDPVLEPMPEPALEPEAAENLLGDPFALPQLPEAEPGFVRVARRKAFWHAPGVRLALALACMVLLLGLALQVARQERNALAASQPSLRPALQGLCALTGCTLSARQDISQVVISGSAFTRSAQPDSYLLSLTITNQAATELAMPAVELTLTDLQDQPVLRRVLLPADLQAPATLGAQAEWSARIPLSVTATSTRIAGYRALVFYP